MKMKTFSAGSYVFNNREYKHIRTLMDALCRENVGADSVSGVSSERKIRVCNGSEIVAFYSVTKPEIGKPMFVERVVS